MTGEGDDDLRPDADRLVAVVRGAVGTKVQDLHVATDHGCRQLTLQALAINWLSGLWKIRRCRCYSASNHYREFQFTESSRCRLLVLDNIPRENLIVRESAFDQAAELLKISRCLIIGERHICM